MNHEVYKSPVLLSGQKVTGKGIYKVKNSNRWLLLFTGLLIFLWSEGFRLQALEFSERYMVLKLAAMFLILLAIVLRAPFVSFHRLFRNFYFWGIIGLFAVVLFPTYVTGILQYGQGLQELLRLPKLYCGMFIFVLLVIHQTRSNFVNRLNALIVVMSVANASLFVAVSFFPEIGHNLLTDSAWILPRFDYPRISTAMTPIIIYSIFYLLHVLIKREYPFKVRKWCFVSLFILLFFLFFVYLSRFIIFGVLLTAGFYFLFYLNIRHKISIMVSLLVIVVLTEIYTKYKPIHLIRNCFTSGWEEYKYADGNVGIRIYGIRYYANEFRKSGYIGIGLVSSVRASQTSVSIGMTQYRYNPADLRIFAVLFQFGFPAIVLTIVILNRMFRDLAFVIRHGNSRHQSIAMAILLYLLYQIFTLSHIFLWHKFAFWTGLFFFMVWRMREVTAREVVRIRRKQESLDPACVNIRR